MDLGVRLVLLAGDRALLCDLGIAKPIETAAADNAAGTDLFVAPELARDQPPSYASDVYSAAVTIRSIMPDPVPDPLDDLLTRAASFRPADRPTDAGEFRRLLRAGRIDTPPGPPAAPDDHVTSSANRRWVVPLAGALAAVAGAALVGYVAYPRPSHGTPAAAWQPPAASTTPHLSSAPPRSSPPATPTLSGTRGAARPDGSAAAGRPPAAVPTPGEETCVYDVKAGVSVPVVSGGSIAGQAHVRAGVVNAISVIVGLDPSISNPGQKHPVALHVRVPSSDVDVTLDQPDIVNNRFTRFNFGTPIDLGGADTTVSMELINRSDNDPVGIYIKRPDASDTVRPPTEGLLITGHREQEPPYRRLDYALSGCIAGRPG